MTKVAFIGVRNSYSSQIADALGKHFASDTFESKIIDLKNRISNE